MNYFIEKTPYTRQRDASLVILAEPILSERTERKPTTSSDITLRESLQWVRVDMEIRLLAARTKSIS